MTAQPALFPTPTPPELPRASAYRHLATEEAKYTAYKGRHQPCDECVMCLHEGTSKTHPLPVRAVRKSRSGELHICMPHKQAWLADDRERTKR